MFLIYVLDIYVHDIYVGDMHRGPHPRSGRRRRTSRSRKFIPDQGWLVDARIERFVEPALLLALEGGPSHGYELADRMVEIADTSIDYGNLYRLLRNLEQEAIVTSRWNDEAPGRSKRTYELTDHGAALLDAWATALRESNHRTAEFLHRYDERNPE
jgi:poly-beta-hydroxybutyrate-responsive repressor